ncbi:hypothetical protein F383_16123 [Gossypium arboreum]|uniref:Uncharacterized protein n=1 Tax=Gossypium arboreum TaxID=29729 RepID=A0A0B0NI39_GOSAR|nr:hypothetical protein F383_16123 [Gossypium arboreum]
MEGRLHRLTPLAKAATLVSIGSSITSIGTQLGSACIAKKTRPLRYPKIVHVAAVWFNKGFRRGFPILQPEVSIGKSLNIRRRAPPLLEFLCFSPGVGWSKDSIVGLSIGKYRLD